MDLLLFLRFFTGLFIEELSETHSLNSTASTRTASHRVTAKGDAYVLATALLDSENFTPVIRFDSSSFKSPAAGTSQGAAALIMFLPAVDRNVLRQKIWSRTQISARGLHWIRVQRLVQSRSEYYEDIMQHRLPCQEGTMRIRCSSLFGVNR